MKNCSLCLILILGYMAGLAKNKDIPEGITGKEPKLKGETTFYMPEDQSTRGYLVLPKKKRKSYGAVILIHEWDGLNDRVRSVADALAKEGYIALCTDLYRGRQGATQAANRALVQRAQARPDKLMRNLNKAIQFLRSRNDVGKIAVLGWGFGGKLALDLAIQGEKHDGTAIFYGRLNQKPEDLEKISHEIFGVFAERDLAIPPKAVNQFTDALAKAGIASDIRIYEGANHGFFLWVDRDAEYNEQPAKEAWDALKTYLKRTISK